MSDLLQTHEQEFAELSAQIRSKIENQVKLAPESQKRRAVQDVEADIEELSDIVEQMDLEARECQQPERGNLVKRVQQFRDKVGGVKKELRKASVAFSEHLREQLMGDSDNMEIDDMSGSDSRQLLMRNTGQIQQTSRNLVQAHRQALEIEQVGISIMDNLNTQRETINHARVSLDETDSNLKRSMRVANAMARRIVQNKVLMYLIIVSIVSLIVLIIYFKLT
eukprot:CFRG3995T1